MVKADEATAVKTPKQAKAVSKKTIGKAVGESIGKKILSIKKGTEIIPDPKIPAPNATIAKKPKPPMAPKEAVTGKPVKKPNLLKVPKGK
jgi:hypothetical protein